MRHEHEWRLWEDVKLPDGKMILPGVVSHATNLIEHPELVAERIMRFAKLVGRENVIAGTDCGLGGRVHAEIAWAKLGALAEGAKLASKRLWLAVGQGACAGPTSSFLRDDDGHAACAALPPYVSIFYRPVRASEFTQPTMRDLALSMSFFEKKSSGLTLSIG